MINQGNAKGLEYLNYGVAGDPLRAGTLSGTAEGMKRDAQVGRYKAVRGGGGGGGGGYVDEGYGDMGYYPMAGFEMPDFGAFIEAMGSNSIDFGSIYAQQMQESANAQGLAQVSALYSAKFDAADKAITEVNQQVADEMAHAKLVGLDYNVDDASKQARINDIFANYWSEADEGQLKSLIGQYGNAGYKWDLPVQRGKSKADAAKEKTPGDSAGAPVKAKTRGTKLSTEENPLGSSPVLG